MKNLRKLIFAIYFIEIVLQINMSVNKTWTFVVLMAVPDL